MSWSSGEGAGKGRSVTDLCLQPQLANSLAIKSRLLRCGRRSQLDLYYPNVSGGASDKSSRIGQRIRTEKALLWVTHVVDAEIVQGLGNLNLLLGVEEGVGELLALAQSALDDLEARDVAQEVANGLVWVRALVGVQLGLEGGVPGMGCN